MMVLFMVAAALPESFNRPLESITLPVNGALKAATVVTWNIDKGTDLNKIAAALKERPAQLYLLQEVDLNTKRGHGVDEAADLAHNLEMNFVYAKEFEELSQEVSGPAFTGQATLTRLPIRRARILRFQHQSGFWKPHDWIPSKLPLMQRRRGSRIALVTELTFDNRLLVVYNIHLESRSFGRIQAEQLDEILADTMKYPPDTAILVGGDVNSKYFPSFFLTKMENADFRSAMGQKIERTHRIAETLDWMFARGPIKLSSGKVDRSAGGSDHFPVYAVMTAN